MKSEVLFSLFQEIDENKVANVGKRLTNYTERDVKEKSFMKGYDIMNKMKGLSIVKIGTAVACVCLLVVGISYFNSNSDRDSGFGNKVDGTVPVGEIEGDIDPIVASIVVAPENESKENVKDAKMDSVFTEEETRNVDGLGKYLPTFIPDGYQFRHASIYKTSMKNENMYYRLVVNYSFADNNTDNMYEEEMDVHDYYSIAIMNYKPREKFDYYTVDTIPQDLSGMGTIHIVCDDIYMDIEIGDLAYDEVLAIVNSIK